MDNMVGKVGRALGQKETEDIIALYGAIAYAGVAGGAVLAGGGAGFSWAGVLALHNTVPGVNVLR